MKKRKMKKPLLWIVVLLLSIAMVAVFSLAGCKAKAAAEEEAAIAVEEEPAVEEPTVEEPAVDLVFWSTPTYDDLAKDTKAVISRFKETYPNVSIRFETVPHAEITAKLQAAIIADQQPDILQDSVNRNSIYMNAGLLASLDDIFTADYSSMFVEKALNQGMLDGTVYIFPRAYDLYGAIINKSLFEEAGALDYLPQNEARTWTREEFEKALVAVKKVPGVYGTGLWTKNEQSDINQRILMEGGVKGSLYNEDFTKVLYDSDRVIEGLEWIISLIEKDLIYPGAESMVDDDVWALFAQKKVAILFTTFWGKSWIEDKLETGEIEPPFEIMVAQYPNASDDTPKTSAPMTGLCIFDKDDPIKIEYAKKFLLFQNEQPEYLNQMWAQLMYPAYLPYSDIFKDDPELNWAANTMADYAYDPGYTSSGFADIRMLQVPEYQAALAGMKTAEQAMKDFTEAANAVLDEIYSK